MQIWLPLLLPFPVLEMEWRCRMQSNAGIPPAHCLALRLVVASGVLLNELELLLQDHRFGRNLCYYLQYPHKVGRRRAVVPVQLHQMAFCK